MIRSFLLLVAVLVAVTPVNAAKRRSRHIVYRPVTRIVTTRTVTTPATTTPANAAPKATENVNPPKSPLQVWAETEAKMMVARR
ncbi:MAG: hypothetical protein ABGZ24_18005 [Fuerstiella sp.]